MAVDFAHLTVTTKRVSKRTLPIYGVESDTPDKEITAFGRYLPP